MFDVTESHAKAICAAYDEEGLISAALELRCLYPSVTEMSVAVEYVLQIVALRAAGKPPAGGLH